MSVLEIVATLFGVLCVALTIKRNIWCWPTGLLMVFCYIFIFYEVKLYSDMALQVVYVFLQIYGWWYWLKGGKSEGQDKVPIRELTHKSKLNWIAAAAILTACVGTAMNQLTDAALPYWDASTTVLSLLAQWLMGRKVLESWLFWIVVDVLSIGIYLTKGLYLTSGLYFVFLIMATAGWFAWRKSSHEGEVKV